MAVKTAPKPPALSHPIKMLLDPHVSLNDKRMLLGQICGDESSGGTRLIEELLGLASEDLAKKQYIAKQKQIDDAMQILRDGPLRLGIYVEPAPGSNGQTVPRAHVVLENGDTTFPIISDKSLEKSLECGDSVLLDAQARAVVLPGPDHYQTGEVAELRRRIDDKRVRVSVTDMHSEAYRMADKLRRQLDADEVQLGAEVLVCTRRRFAFEALPMEEGLSSYKFLETSPLQEVDAQRDIGAPHPFIDELVTHVRDEMTNPELGRKYGVRPMQTRLLKGLTGTGKSLSILAVIHGVYRVMSEVTGAPIEALPNRVLRMRMSQVLNKYLGESDKRQDRFYDEVIQLANDTFTWDGREWKLPVIARCEEIDSLARARNGAEDVMGRIQTTALERLDHLSGELGQSLCIFLFTTNVPELCDQAFIRRAGGKIIDFGRVGRGQFQAILSKKIRDLPMASTMDTNPRHAAQRVVREVTEWMFSPNGHDPGQVEVTFAGSATKDIKYRRDLLTGSVVDLSVQQACQEAKEIEKQGQQPPGLTTQLILSAFERQIRGMCEQITEFNAHNYLPLPDGARVGSVRRIEQPVIPSYDLEQRDPPR